MASAKQQQRKLAAGERRVIDVCASVEDSLILCSLWDVT
jgi:hypothetical protein